MIILPVLFVKWERQAYVNSSSCGHYDHIRRWPRRWPFISRHRDCSSGVWGRSHPNSTYRFHRPSLTLRRLFRGPSACSAVWRNMTLLIGCIHRPSSNCYFRNPNSRNKGNCLSCRGITPLAVHVDTRFHHHHLLFCVVAKLETDNIQRVVHQPSACIL